MKNLGFLTDLQITTCFFYASEWLLRNLLTLERFVSACQRQSVANIVSTKNRNYNPTSGYVQEMIFSGQLSYI